jgi:hypothetical protein
VITRAQSNSTRNRSSKGSTQVYNRRITGIATAAAVGSALGGLGIAGARTRPQGQGPQDAGAVALGGLVTALIQNVRALAAVDPEASLPTLLQNALRHADVTLLTLNDVLDAAQIDVLSDILHHSPTLSTTAIDVLNVLNDNERVRNVLDSSNLAIGQVLAVDVLSAPVTVYLFAPR